MLSQVQVKSNSMCTSQIIINTRTFKYRSMNYEIYIKINYVNNKIKGHAVVCSLLAHLWPQARLARAAAGSVRGGRR
jgi:hypothetical protein